MELKWTLWKDPQKVLNKKMSSERTLSKGPQKVPKRSTPPLTQRKTQLALWTFWWLGPFRDILLDFYTTSPWPCAPQIDPEQLAVIALDLFATPPLHDYWDTLLDLFAFSVKRSMPAASCKYAPTDLLMSCIQCLIYYGVHLHCESTLRPRTFFRLGYIHEIR